MTESDDAAELLFFDTFSHEVDTDINLDLVQFPKPVYITQVRIIPLGARVQADFPGGVRLGATNPSKFDIEFFVNDLGMPGASTFENLGQLKYNQNDCIHLECTLEKIPTDGLVLRGWYSTITLAVYGILTNSLNEPIASPPPPPCEPAGPEDICNLNATAAVEGRDAGLVEDNIKEDWKEPLPGEAPHVHKNPSNIDFEREDLEYGMSSREHYHHLSGDERERERERDRRLRKTSRSSERSASSRNRTHSESNERDYMRGRTDRGCDRERERDRDREREKSTREWSRSPEYSRRARRKRSERSRSDAEETHKWPRTPPASIDSPLRPRSPDTMDYTVEDPEEDGRYKSKASLPLPHVYRRSSNESIDNTVTETIEDDEAIVGDQFEPILSDDEIIGDDDSEQAAVDELEMEVDAAAATAGPAIEQFNPFTTAILKYVGDLGVYYQKDLDALQAILHKFESHFKCENVEIFRAATTTVEDRESFVHLTEQLINQLACLGQKFQQRNYVLQQCFRDKKDNCEQAYRALRISLDFESACSQPQPTFKIRHMKAGARLAELLGSSPEFVTYLLQTAKFDPFEAVFALYRQDYMALSIKLMLLRSIYGLLDTKVGLQHFLNGKVNGYQLLLEMLQVTHLTRVKYALRAIIKKLHLHEALEYVREQCTKLFVLSNYKCDEPERDFAVIEHALRQIIDALAVNALSYQQLKRFLPVCKKFEIVPDLVAERNFANALQTYFKKHSLAESLLLLLSNCEDLPRSLMLRILDVLQALMQTHVGVDYLVDDCFSTTRLLVAVLLGLEDLPGEEVVGIKAEDEGAVENIKTEQIESNVSVEAVTVKIEKKDIDSEQPVEATEKALPMDAVDATEKGVSTPTTDAGSATTDVVDEVVPITTTSRSTATIEPFKPSSLNRMQKLGVELAYKAQTRYHLDAIVYVSESSNYDGFKLTEHLHALYSQTCNATGRQHTVEVLGMNNNLKVCMQLIKHEQRLQAQRQMSMPGSKYKSPVLSYAVDMLDCCVRYCESLDYLLAHGASILELAKNHETFEPSVSAVLQEMSVYLKPVEAVNLFTCADIMPLVDVITRSLEYITTFPGDLIMGLRILRHLTIGVENKALKSTDTEELKYRFVTLQFYSADGMQILMQVLEKLCAYFEQPGLHTPALMTLQGVHCCQIVLSTLQILRAMLTYAIQCRDVEFKDLTAIDHLMKTYFLLHYFPAASQAAPDVELAKQEIIKILLAYTQPNEQDEESLHKSLWTQMIREVLKNIDGPATFIPGLLVLAELLPLPLPIPVHRSRKPPENHAQRLISERKLWSAHLHAQSAQIAKLIETIAPTSFPQLSDLLVKVCLQLADLAPNMTLLISKTLSDMLHGEWIASGNKPNLLLGRLLTFLGSLTVHPALKSSAMSMLLGSLWEVFQSILLQTENTPVVRKCQLAVHRILASFLDVNISLVSEQANKAIDLNLASSLPPYELMSNIAETLLSNLFNADLTSEMPILALRNLTKLTEHDIPFQSLSQQLKQKSNEFQQWMQKLSTSPKSDNRLAVVESALKLMQGLTRIDQTAAHPKTLPMRTLKFSPIELAAVIGFQKDINQANPLLCLRAICEHHKGDMTTSTLLSDIDRLNSQVVVALEGNTTTPLEVNEDTSCMHEELPQAESIVMQYVGRPIFKEYDPDSDSVKLTSDYWLKPLCLNALTTEDFETKYERVACDLTELASNCLSPETNLTSDCKRVLHLAASPQSNRERTPTAPCFRTRRVEVEPSTGRPEKKLYITPVRGRGFPRPPPSRGDIFRSRPPNTSRPPSLHVDDFLALETCGAQPTGPTGYNKIPPLMRGSRVGRNRGSRIAAVAAYRKSKLMRTSSPSMWTSESISAHYRSATSEPHFGESHYASSSPYGGRPRGRGNRSRIFMR